jgi:hypothetical protein
MKRWYRTVAEVDTEEVDLTPGTDEVDLDRSRLSLVDAMDGQHLEQRFI